MVRSWRAKEFGKRVDRALDAIGRKRELNSNLSGNEVYYRIVLILLVKIMLCSKPHCQRERERSLLTTH